MKDFLSSTAAPTVALPTAGTGLSQVMDLAAALNHTRKPDGRYLVALKEGADPTDPDYFRFVSPAERVDLMVDRRFIILEPKRLEKLIGHPILTAGDNRPILGDNERRMVAGMLAVEDGVIRNPNFTTEQKSGILDKIKAEFKQPPKGFMVENYRVESMISVVSQFPPSPWTPLEEKMKKFSTDQIEQLIGRKIERGVNKKHALSDPEADFLGLALGMHEAVQAEPGSRQREIRFGACIKKCAELHGAPAAKRLARFLRKLLTHKIEKLNGELGEIRSAKAAAEEMSAWIGGPLVLERPDGSRLHDVRQKLLDESVVILYTELQTGNPGILNNNGDGDIHGFVVEHDWAKAFQGAGEFDAGEFALPYTVSFFEFQVTGRRVAMLIVQDDRGATMVPFFAWSGGWSLLPAYDLDVGTGKVSIPATKTDVGLGILQLFLPLMELLAKNVRAVCISLEAEVAESTVVRADHRLNRAREKRGKLPLHDYHVVSLAHRSRVPSLPKNELDPDREITRKRCHFRRGHWRHYENHKTWIKWCLVGDPDLGFVDKHYKL